MFTVNHAPVLKSVLGYSGLRRSRGFTIIRGGMASTQVKTLTSSNQTNAQLMNVSTDPATLSINGLSTRPLAAVATSVGDSSSTKTVTLTAKVTIRQRKFHPMSVHERVSDHLDSLFDSVFGQKVLLQLVSVNVDPKTGVGKRSKKSELLDWAGKANLEADKVVYVARFDVYMGFGKPGAIAMQNWHANEFFVETISLEGWPSAGCIYFPCYSWVHPGRLDPRDRIFFANQALLPSETPPGLKDLREKDLASLRGSHKTTAVRKSWERIYDYSTYNDIGNPDKDAQLARPTLGGSKEFPYPRRCRTGRIASRTDKRAESVLDMSSRYYVPRDDVFDQIKQESFLQDTIDGAVRQIIPCLLTSNFADTYVNFRGFTEIDGLYSQESSFTPKVQSGANLTSPDQLIKQMQEFSRETITNRLNYPRPDIVAKGKFTWLRDVEFGREVLAGANPVKVEQLTAFPPVSKLDPEIYGSQESVLTHEHLEGQLGGLSLEEALVEKKLFILDYHDIFMPFVNKINALKDRKMYASRTILFLTSEGTLIPIAIELSLPPASPGALGLKRVLTPGHSPSSFWLWQLAKAHVSSNDAGFHQLHNHWLRSHAAVEPYIIATHRNLSQMHPIFKLLQPHFRYTLEINALARQLLINAGGVIEDCFTPGPYSLEISSAAYQSLWRFDREGLPADLLSRGMAMENANRPEGIELVIEDYPYAADGLLIWSAIKSWVKEYVSLYYSDSSQSVLEDSEIQNWWKEIREVGHGDKASEPWWPKLRTAKDLEEILTTIIWVATGFHAALNFGQYAYGGYVPNRPCITRRLIPEEGAEEERELLSNPEKFFLSTIPNQQQATTTMSVVNTLSTHSPDEEYLGHRSQVRWTEDDAALQASSRFAETVQTIEQLIEERNRDPSLKNRNGAGVLPYELLIPSSQPGRTGRGIPNSISI